MAKRSSNANGFVEAQEGIDSLINLRFTHKKFSMVYLEKVTFKDPNGVQEELLSLSCAEECIILQTCNRVEIYAVAKESNLRKTGTKIEEYWRKSAELSKNEFNKFIEKSFKIDALTHLMRLASGLESMMVGEDQILGQIQAALEKSKKYHTSGSILDSTFNRAIKTGKKVRFETKINKGAVSIASAAVKLLESKLGNLNKKKIAIIGAGKTGRLLTKALVSKKQTKIYIVNRTYETSKKLAKVLNGIPVPFINLNSVIVEVDAVIVATAAPHYTLTKEAFQDALNARKMKKIFVMDISQPRNVEESIGELLNVELYDIDDLREIAELNLKKRLKQAEKAEAMIDDDLKLFKIILKREEAEPIVTNLCSKAEEIRLKELKKALKMLGKMDVKEKKVIEDLTQVITERILYDPVMNLRKAAEYSDINTLKTAKKLFRLD
ncbi:MAG: glutamyl-tRNA reductase [Candidatus Bathyarchaeota archaeon]|nr:glutamyl-tRNA reductase [Candidatus Bathyarchaeota archaeon]